MQFFYLGSKNWSYGNLDKGKASSSPRCLSRFVQWAIPRNTAAAGAGVNAFGAGYSAGLNYNTANGNVELSGDWGVDVNQTVRSVRRQHLLRNTQINGGNIIEQIQMQTSLADIFETDIGQQMRGVLDQSGTTLQVNINYGNQHYAYVNSGSVWVDPVHRPNYLSVHGLTQFSTTRIVAHEMGHAVMGARDNGPRSMFNVYNYENPIMRQLGDPYDRIMY